MLNSIRLLRGVAALLVVVYHVCEYLRLHGFPTLVNAFPMGAIGVDLFFAVSGFVMLHALEGKPDAGPGWRNSGDFLVRRIIRVVPIYWIGTTALYGVFVAMPGKFKLFTATFGQYWHSILFLPSEGAGGTIRPLLSQGWTLYHEMYFYLILALAVLVMGARRAGLFTAVSVALLLVLSRLAIGDAPVPWLELIGSPINLEFVLGAGVYGIYRSKLSDGSRYILAALALALGVVSYGDYSHIKTWSRLTSWGAISVSVFILFLLMEHHVTRLGGWLCTYLGDPSYSLYIFHGLAFSAIDLFLRKIPGHDHIAVMMLVLCLGVVLISNGIYRWLERPMTARVNRWWSARQRRVAV